jgi:hypothetical protein
MNNTYTVRVRLPNGGFTDVQISAISSGYARQIAEAQYGSANFIAIVG